jgi:hypothetical protein
VSRAPTWSGKVAGVGFDYTFVVAQWDRPLTELRVNERLDPPEWSAPDEELSWSRADGWQCFVPEAACYDEDVLLPPVREIAGETGGMVLGLTTVQNDHYELAFIEGGALRSIAYGPYDGTSEDVYERQMVVEWGEPWRTAAAASLHRWAEPFPGVSQFALWGALSVPQVFAQHTAFDLLRLLTLVPDEGAVEEDQDPLNIGLRWTEEIPGAVYAIDNRSIIHPGLESSGNRWLHRDLALAFTDSGVGVWSLAGSRWHTEPVRDLTGALDALRQELRRQGWTDRT